MCAAANSTGAFDTGGNETAVFQFVPGRFFASVRNSAATARNSRITTSLIQRSTPADEHFPAELQGAAAIICATSWLCRVKKVFKMAFSSMSMEGFAYEPASVLIEGTVAEL